MKVFLWTAAAALAGVFTLGATMQLARAGMIPAWLT